MSNSGRSVGIKSGGNESAIKNVENVSSCVWLALHLCYGQKIYYYYSGGSVGFSRPNSVFH